MTPVPPGREPAREGPRRREVLDTLREAGTPIGVADVAARIGVHPNTARFHLDALVADGSAERSLDGPSGPGRPRTVYVPRRGMDRGGARGYDLLAEVLLSRLAETGKGAGEEATEAGRAWGRYLITRMPPFRRPTAGEAVSRLTGLLTDLGFAPDPVLRGDRGDGPGGGGVGVGVGVGDGAGSPGGGEVPERIRLRHCPFLELAEEYRALVCPLHLGLMQGALAELRAPVAATGLEPFAEPDACLAHLGPAAGAATGHHTF